MKLTKYALIAGMSAMALLSPLGSAPAPAAAAIEMNGSVSGTISLADYGYFEKGSGDPFPASVRLMTVFSGMIDGVIYGQRVSIDDLGNFTITGVPTNTRLTLQFSGKPGTPYDEEPVATVYLGGGVTAGSAEIFELGSGEHRAFHAHLGHSVGTVGGRMVDEAGNGLSGSIAVYKGDEASYWTLVGTTTAAQDGTFRYTGPTGSYNFGFARRGSAVSHPSGGLAEGITYKSQWYKGAYKYESATPVNVMTGEPGPGSSLGNIVLHEHGWVQPNLEDGTYVALGDSFQSGEGTFDYYPETNRADENMCHRSKLAYPQLLVDYGIVGSELNFRACSGALIEDLSQSSDPSGPPWDDGIAQLDALSVDTRLITLGIGGNDLGFASTIRDCITQGIKGNDDGYLMHYISCEATLGPGVSDAIASLERGQKRQELIDVYREVRERAPYARVVVVTYPSFFPADGTTDFFCGSTIRTSDQIWINSMIRRADTAIANAARSAGFEVANVVDALDGHEQCTDNQGMHNLISTWHAESFHPNALGHELMANVVAPAIGATVFPDFTSYPNETVTTHAEVTGQILTVSTTWPGSDVITTLVSPSGVIYSRDSHAGASHGNGATSEYYTIVDPEHGTWTISSFGADVAVDGEPVWLRIADEQPVNLLPVATFSATGDGQFVTFDATGSTDADGSIARYLWDFGDGTSAEGAVVDHVYEQPGTYSVVVTVTDEDGDQDFYTDSQIYGEEVTDPELPIGPVVYSATSLTLTNQFATSGESPDIYVDGDYTCNSAVAVGGSVIATGKAYLTTSCHIAGSLQAGGAVKMDASAVVDGDVTAGGSVTIQSSNRIGGSVLAGGAFISLDGKSSAYLLANGTVGGTITGNAETPAIESPESPFRAFSPVDSEGFTTITWKQWMNATAMENNAPPWSQGRTANPGCVMAPWGSSVNGSTVAINEDTVIDARQQASACATVSLQGMNLQVSADVVILANSFSAVNGVRIESADGLSHSVRILVPGEQPSCGSNRTVSLSAATHVAPEVTLGVVTPGKVVVNGPSVLRGSIAAGCVSASGSVRIDNAG